MDALMAGRAGLAAADAGVAATSHNVANASTPGFTRRGVEQSTGTPVRRGGLWIGGGPRVDAIARRSDALLGARRITATANEASASERMSVLMQAETALADGPGALRPTLDGFFNSLTRATQDPGDPALRAEVLDRASVMADSFNRSAESLVEIRDAQFDRVEIHAEEINDVLGRIASLNGELEAAGGAVVAGDLADERDRLLRTAAEVVGAEVHIEQDGQATVFIGGHAAVSGRDARWVSTDRTGSVPVLTLAVDRGVVNLDAGGRIGGAIDAAIKAESYLTSLDTIAQELSDAVNTVHQSGFDATGTAGQQLFTYDPTDPASSMSLATVMVDNPDALAFAATTPAASGDGDNLRALMSIETLTLPSGQTAGDAMSAVVSAVGRDVASAARAADQHGQTLNDLETLTANLEGVDLDEEAGNLLMYQAAYRAAAKVIATSDALMGALMEII